MKTRQYQNGTPWMDLFENVSIYNLLPEAFIQNSTTKQADTTFHFLSPRTGTCDIFMVAVADTKCNFNAPIEIQERNTHIQSCLTTPPPPVSDTYASVTRICLQLKTQGYH